MDAIQMNSEQKCAKCLSFVGFRYLLAIIIGLGIGAIGTLFVEIPPAATLIANIQLNEMVARKTNLLDRRVTIIEAEVQKIKIHTH